MYKILQFNGEVVGALVILADSLLREGVLTEEGMVIALSTVKVAKNQEAMVALPTGTLKVLLLLNKQIMI